MQQSIVRRAAHTACRAFATIVVVGAAIGAQAQTAINQDTVLAGTNYGYLQDAPGFPLAIFVPGSYKLTGNLLVPPGASGIEIYGRGVTIDMNGFEIRTTAVCTRDENSGGVQCPNSLGKVGVDMKGGGNVLRNGRISGFISGVHFKGADHLENLLVENNVHGVVSEPFSGARTLIRNVRAQNNDESGFWAHSALVQGSSSSGNGGNGFYLGQSMVIDSFAAKNNGVGFRGFGDSSLALGRNTSWNNRGGDFSHTTSMGDNLNSGYQRF